MAKKKPDPRQLSLFGTPEAPAATPPRPVAIPAHVAELASMLPDELHLGTSSWAFPGWRGIVYADSHERETLAAQGLAAYARHPLLRTVGLDRTFYRPESVDGMREIARELPSGFRMLVKAPAALTRPAVPPDGGRKAASDGRWEDNPLFLDAEWATREAVAPIAEGLADRAGPLVFQFSPLPRFRLREPARFVEGLHAFLRALPRGPLYAVELRNREILGDEYAAALADTGACHAFNVHPTMPGPSAQLDSLGPRACATALVVRWMLGHRQKYEDAKSRYAPFDRILDPDPASRHEIIELAADALGTVKPVFVVINNKAEGSAPLSAFELAAALVDARRG
jgi:uncharacterized protein YecE (DUF72 family)